jgi:hypothetical protein
MADDAAKEARHGEKMIEVKIRFWTDNIAGTKDKVIPKQAWTSGVVRVERNDAHGISPSRGVPFNSLLDVGVAIENPRGPARYTNKRSILWFPKQTSSFRQLRKFDRMS